MSETEVKAPLQRVCYFGTYRAEYSRNRIMIEGLRRAGVEVTECNEQLWHGIEDRVETTSGGWMKPAFWGRVIKAYLPLLTRYFRSGDYDVLVVGYPGQFDVYLARILSWLRRKPLVWDIFMSIYLIALERQLDQRSRFTVGMLRLVERLAARLPDRLILDTSQYVEWFSKTHHIDPTRFRLVPTGADDRVFKPVTPQERHDHQFLVLYYGTFIPNHGVESIIEAAHLLRNEPGICFELIGSGPDKLKAAAMAEGYGLTNIRFVDWMEQCDLVQRAADADLCLGAFGATPQSLITVQNKIYEGLAMRKPVVTGDSPAVRQELVHCEHIFLCNRMSGSSLAEAILTLRDDTNLRLHLADNGYSRFKEAFDLENIGQRYSTHLQEVVHQSKKDRR